MPLTDTRIRNSKPAEKPYRLPDGAGLHLEVRPNGSRLWRYRYRLAGRENVYAVGTYPDVTLAGARVERDLSRALVKQGIHPSHHRKLERVRKAHENANTFEAVAGEWISSQNDHWTAKTLGQRNYILEHDVFPAFGLLPVRQLTPALCLSVLKRIEKRAPTMAAIANQTISAVCRYAVATLRADSDPTAPLRGALRARPVEHRKPLAADEIPGFIRALEAYPGYFSNKIALSLLLLTLVRTTELLEAPWSEFNLVGALWRIPAERMKMREPHTVPLSRQALELLKKLYAVTGNGEYLFPNRSNLRRPASRGVLWKGIASMGYAGKFSPHGIRATGSTILNELGFRTDVIERQLAHAERNKTRAAYNTAEYLPDAPNAAGMGRPSGRSGCGSERDTHAASRHLREEWTTTMSF